MKTYMIENIPYVSLRELCNYVGINTGMYNYYIQKDPALKTFVIEHFRPPTGGHSIHLISKDGVYRFLGHFIANAKNKSTDKYYKAMDVIEDNIKLFDNDGDHPAPAPMCDDIPPDVGTAVARPIATGYMPPTAEQGIEISNAIFDGHNVRYRVDDKGMQWVLGQDVKDVIGLQQPSFSKIISRINKKDPLAIQHDAASCWSLRGGKPRISLNKYGMAQFFMELDTERLKDPTTREKCNRFRVWIARLVGDVMTGDVKLNQSTPTPDFAQGVPTITPVNVYAIVSNTYAALSVGIQVGLVFDKIPARDIMHTTFTQISKTTNMDMSDYRDLVLKHYNETEPLCMGTTRLKTLQQEFNMLTESAVAELKILKNNMESIPTLETRIEHVERGIRNNAAPRHIVISMENNGFTKNEIEKVVCDAEHLAANEIS